MIVHCGVLPCISISVLLLVNAFNSNTWYLKVFGKFGIGAALIYTAGVSIHQIHSNDGIETSVIYGYSTKIVLMIYMYLPSFPWAVAGEH